MNLLLVFIGSGLGGMLRFGVQRGCFALFGAMFPYGTLIVNLTGSFLMGFLFILISSRSVLIAPQLGAFLLIGFLGGYTTFSAFSLETVTLFENGLSLYTLINILLNLILSISFCYLGMGISRYIFFPN